MRSIQSFLVLLALTSCAAADVVVRVADPRAAVVAGAEVRIYPSAASEAAVGQQTSSEGVARFTALPDGEYRVEVRAAGFAPASKTVRIAGESNISISLKIAPLAQTVVVSATRTPVPVEESGAQVALLDASDIRNLQPVATSDALRYLPGAVVNQAGQRGGQASLFVRGGESRYNKVIIDGVPVNEPGGTFDFGVVPMTGIERMEFVRGAESVLYGSDAMTSVVQMWSATGRTPVPEVRFGADGGTFGTARGYASIAGARGRLDYNLFGQQDATQGQGQNDDYSNSIQGANVGVMLSPKVFLRLRTRHADSRSGVQGQWVFGGQQLLNPDIDADARQNNFLGSAELTVTAPNHWQHRFTGYEYNHKGINQDSFLGGPSDRGCNLTDPLNLNFFDCFFSSPFKVNTAGFQYQADYSPRSWARTTFGYEFEDENGFFDSAFATFDFVNNAGPVIGTANAHGLRRNHSMFAQQAITYKRFTARAGFRYVHNEDFGGKVVPQAAFSVVARQGGDTFGPTRFTASYSQGFKEPRFEEVFGFTGTSATNPNLSLRPEQNRAFEAGVSQTLLTGRHSFSATYFNNLFRDQIQFDFLSSQYFNVAKSMAQGAELEWHSRLTPNLSATASYVHTSGQILLNPGGAPPFAAGDPLLRRPRNLGSLLLNYSGRHWGGSVAGSLVGRRFDSDFLFGLVPPQDHTAGYARVDLGAWYAVNRYAIVYANVENALNRRYEEVSGYPALKANFRAGMRFRFGGE